MALLTDTNITLIQDDYPGADTNSPLGTDSMAGVLDDQLRNVKSIVRQESTNKGWVRYLGLKSAPSVNAPAYLSTTSFSLTGDWVTPGITLVGRRIKATVTAGTVYGYINAASYNGVITTVTVVMDGTQVLDAGLSEIMLGAELGTLGSGTTTAAASAVPAQVQTQITLPLYCTVDNGGAGVAFTGTLAPAITAYLDGQQYRFKFVHANGGGDTIALNGLTAYPLVRSLTGSIGPVVFGDILAGQEINCTYDGANTRFVMTSLPTGIAVAKSVASNSLSIVAGGGNTQATCTVNPDAILAGTNGAGQAIVGTAQATLDISVAGPALNGRDQAGAFGANASIHVYIIGGGGKTGGFIASLTAPSTGPALPAGYTAWAYLGSFLLDGAGNFQNCRLDGKHVTYANPVSILNAGAATVETQIAALGIPAAAVRFYAKASLVLTTGANASITGSLRWFSGAVYLSLRRDIVSGVGSGLAGSETTFDMPVTGSGLYYLIATSAGTSPGMSIWTTGYDVANGV